MQTSCEKAPVDKVDAAKSTTLLQSITNLAALPVEIYCDDSWLDTTDVAGDVNTGKCKSDGLVHPSPCFRL